MPATESTWYNMTFMHRVFAVSGVVLTLATIWMFYKDHNRAWKDIQNKNVEMEVMFTELREAQFETAQVQSDVARLAIAESEAKAQPIDEAAVLAFKAELQAELLRLETRAKKTDHQEVKFGVSDDQLKALRTAAEEAAAERAKARAARAAADADLNNAELQSAAREALKQAEAKEAAAAKLRARIVATLAGYVNQAKINEDAKNLQRKFQSAHVDKAKADLDIAIRDNLDQTGPQKKINEEVAEFNALRDEYQHLSAHRKELENILKNITAPVDAASKALADAQAAHKRLETTVREKREGYLVKYDGFPYYGPGKDILNLPILDAFGSTRKPDTKWSADLLQDYTHAKVRRFDRCTTCHGAMQKSLPGDPTSPLFAAESSFDVLLIPRTPEEIKAQRAELKKPELDADKNPIPYTVEEYLGVKLADGGLLNSDDVIVKYVEPKSPGAAAQPVDPAAAAQLPTGAEILQQVASGITPAAAAEIPNRPGLLVADVIEAVGDSDLSGQNRGARRIGATMVDLAALGKPFTIRIRRGLPHPYNSHPRLDLFISDSSPHKLSTFACTICHEGQGSATEFKWASHTPNDQIEQERWAKDSNLGWFNNHHWIYPMYPERFTQATCLKCHHDVVELEPSEKFPDPPAAKLMHGYQLIRKYGCYGCHEVNGYDGPTKRVGPDLRLEPNFFAAAQQFDFEVPTRASELNKSVAELNQTVAELTKPVVELNKAIEELNKAEESDAKTEKLKALSEQLKAASAQLKVASTQLEFATAQKNQLAEMMRLARELTAHPDNDATRRRLMTMINEDAAIPADQQTLPGPTHRLGGMFSDVDAPGTLRKAGPSLRFVKEKLDEVFLYDWIWNPKNFRESTRMPRFFGLTDHLADKESLDITHNLEPIEVRGLVAYLQDRSQTFEPIPRPAGIDNWSDEAMIGRGKQLFETRGCLACHTHSDFPDTSKFRPKEEIVQGPDLSNIGQKFALATNPKGPSWLYSWIKEPTKYHPRTVMPNLYLEPLQVRDPSDKDAEGNPKTKWADPAEDITTYLLSNNTGKWKPVLPKEKLAETYIFSEAEAKALRDLTIEYLNEPFFKDDVERDEGYYEKGLPESMRSELKGAETELIVAKGQSLTDAQRLRYIGLKTVSKYGCYGCHDIPGFEDAKPIGTQLQNWGRKDPSRLAFEHITHYIEHGHGAKHGHGKHDDHDKHDSKPAAATSSDSGGTADSGDKGLATGNEPAPVTAIAHEDHLPVGFEDYYESQLGGGSRIGFIYQKLKEPRSYDYDKTLNKRFNERLRMPQFPFTAEDREAVITFVLGLVAEPPREKYLYRANPRAKAIADGKIVLEKFNCGGCHILEADKWKLSFTPGAYDPQAIADPVYPFLVPHFTPAELAKSGTPDASNQLHAVLAGIPKMSKETGLPEIVNEEGDVLNADDRYDPKKTRVSVEVVKPTTLAGGGYLPGLSSVSVAGNTVTNAYTGQGGMLTRYLQPRVTKMAQDPENVFAPGTTGASGVESYGWLPPPLYGEGNKVQSNWLYEFLLEPYPIRPAVFLRMPKFNMSRDDATKLVNYFAAVDNANYPYEASEVRQDSRLVERQAAYEKRAAEDGKPNANRLDDAMKIVINKKSFCAQCHIIADFQPDGQGRNRGPNLADVYRRLRPDYLRDWIANPKMILPYTGMPVNFGYEPHVHQHSKIPAADFVGDGEQAVDALVDLLMNFDHYSKQKNLIAPQIPAAPATATDAPAPAAGTQD
jgi:cytochrome c551/c552